MGPAGPGQGERGRCGNGPTLTPGSPQATEQLQIALRDPASLPALCELLASAGDPQVRFLPLPAEFPIVRHMSSPSSCPRQLSQHLPARTLTCLLHRPRSASSRPY